MDNKGTAYLQSLESVDLRGSIYVWGAGWMEDRTFCFSPAVCSRGKAERGGRDPVSGGVGCGRQ